MRNNQIFIISVNSEKDEDEERGVDETATEIKNTENDASYWNFLHIGTIICISVTQLTLVMLVPRHNSIIYPSYWFEMPILLCFNSITVTVNIIASIFLFTNQKAILKIANFLRFYSLYAISNVLIFTLAYFLWIIVFDKNHPTPFLGLIGGLGSLAALSAAIFYSIPSDLLKVIDFKGKLKSYLMYLYYWFFIQLQKDVLSIIFNKLPTNFQFVVAFIIPLARESNKRVLSQFVEAMAGKEDERANVWMCITINIHYALFITIRLAGAENITVFSIMTIDFILHLMFTYDIIKADRKLIRQSPNKDQNENERKKGKETERVKTHFG